MEFGELDLNRAMQVYGPAGDLSTFRGRYYPSKAPLMSFAAVPVYAALRVLFGGNPQAVSELAQVYFSRLILTVFPTLFLLVGLRRFLRVYVPPGAADAVVLTYALGTLGFSYSLLFMSHQPSSVLLFATFYGIWRWSRGDWSESRLPLCGMLASASIVAEYTTTLGVFCLALYGVLVLIQRREALGASIRAASTFVLGAVPLLLLLAWYHTRVFGGPLETGYRHLADVAYQPWHDGGFLGIGLPKERAFVLSFLSPLRGLFVLSPALLLAVPGLVLVFRRMRNETELRPVAWTTVAIVCAYTYFTASFSYDSWGWTTGPRHLTPLVPFLLLPCALAIDRAQGTLVRGPCGVLLAASVVVTSALTFINYIPDNVSSAIVALAIPLSTAGYLVPSLLCTVGLTNPEAGILLWLAIVLVGSWLVWFLPPQASPAGWLLTLGTIGVLMAVPAVSYTGSVQDYAARSLLERVWLAPPRRPIALITPSH